MLRLTKETKDKLTRYFINADPPLWNVLENKNKKGRLRELKEAGLLPGYSEGTNFTYNKLNQDLLVEAGIETILEHIVVPRIKKLFTQETLEYFRRCWEQGQTPTLQYLKQKKLYRKHTFSNVEVFDDGWAVPPVTGYKESAFIFVQIDTQHNYVERWTVFAGLWFEEIEPLLSSKPDIDNTGGR